MTTEQENEELKKEVIRLRIIIMMEGAKWLANHNDEAGKKYWLDFMSSSIK